MVELARHDLASPGDAPPKAKQKLSELCGLGAELWQGGDMDQFVNDERDEWDAPKAQ
ncbi:MAG TPA: hypothetical protein VGK19_23810 [Capsulimonadaceae bacterium]